jgi:hypothetical protein
MKNKPDLYEVRDREDRGCRHDDIVADANGDRWCGDCHRPFDHDWMLDD